MSSSNPISPIGPSPGEIERFSVSPRENPIWSMFDVAMIAIFGFVSQVIFGGLAILVAHSLPGFRKVPLVDLAQNTFVLVSAQTVAYLLLVAFMVTMVRRRELEAGAPWDSHPAGPAILKPRQDFLAAIRWNTPSLQTALTALGGGAGLALFSEVFSGLLQKWVPKTLPIDQYFRDRSSAYLLALFGVLVAPFVEELFFRGFLYPVLARRIGIGASVVLTAAAFAVVHQGQLAHAWVPLAWLFVVGTVLTLVRAKTKSVATSVLIHVGYNATLFTLLFIITQGFRHMEKA